MRMVVRTYEPLLAQPVEFFRLVWRDLRRSFPLATELAKRDVRNQYRQSLFGPAAVILVPLVMTAIALGFRRTGILKVDSSGIPYALFVLTGVILWITFLEALNAPIQGLLLGQRLLTRTSAPPEAILLGKLGVWFVNVFIRISILAIAIVWYRISIPVTIVLAPIGLLSLAALGSSVGLLIAPINLLYRDLSWILGSVTTIWFFFSPVYFPAPATGMIGTIMQINPVTPILSATRSLMLTGTIANPVRSLLIMLGTCGLLVACWFYSRIVLCVALEQVNE
jgi:lipopolysaccharide transport system permease protein